MCTHRVCAYKYRHTCLSAREIHVPFGLEVKCAVYALPDYDNVKSKLNSHRIFVCSVALVTEFNSDVLAPEEDMTVSFCGCCEQACNI